MRLHRRMVHCAAPPRPAPPCTLLPTVPGSIGKISKDCVSMNGSNVTALDEKNFDAEVLAQDNLVLVDFWSEGCVPCKQLHRVLGQLASEIPPNIRIGTVDIGRSPSLVERFGVRSAPTLLFFKAGAVVETRTGVDRRQVLKKLVETHA